MKKIVSMFVLSAAANVANAEVITLKCDGTNANGESTTEKVHFSPDQGWAKLEYVDVKMTGAVKADYINVFLLEMRINRETGEFTKGTGDAIFKGKCAKHETKF